MNLDFEPRKPNRNYSKDKVMIIVFSLRFVVQWITDSFAGDYKSIIFQKRVEWRVLRELLGTKNINISTLPEIRQGCNKSCNIEPKRNWNWCKPFYLSSQHTQYWVRLPSVREPEMPSKKSRDFITASWRSLSFQLIARFIFCRLCVIGKSTRRQEKRFLVIT